MAENAEKHDHAQAPVDVLALVRRFAEHAESYGSGGHGSYNETQIRREFIDPLFKALGWDIDNTAGHAEAYKDVIHEDAIRIGGATKAPDYCFRIGGVRKFFVEAKKPAIDLKADALPAYQLRRYAWSAKLPLSILTDFEEIAVYDCRVKPAENDKASTARTLYIRYDELPERWHELASIFSRDAILRGAFDRYAESAKKKRGTAEVDDAFLAEIEDWRDMLARNIALRNEDLSQRDLNFAVQRTIDRIVFLRICEDRGIERYGTLQALTNGDKVYDRLFERFRHADDRYNSGLFHFTREKGRADAPDDLTPSLVIDDKPLKDILRRLYYPECPYEFSVLPADILGHVYEQFLGKVIRLTAGHRAVVEEKPEVRKAGGVYYTPTYIVDYIVKQTVGVLVDGATPQEIGGLTGGYQPSKSKDTRPLTVLDPACGSGSFLLGAYQFLLDWYRDRYVDGGTENHTKGKTPRLFQHGSGDYRLTTAERKRILLSHIYGVDIDPQAVEVTKLSLLLKVLEGESAENVDAGLRLFHERALPDLANNIKCGNSLIAPDFYDDVQMSMFDEDQRVKINVFDWNREFADIMRVGGFDAVIGNPPYDVLEKNRGQASWPHEALADYVRSRSIYAGAKGGKTNLFRFFLVRALRLARDNGRFGMIVPMALLGDISCSATRTDLLANSDGVELDCFPQKDKAKRRVFLNAKLSTVIVTASRSRRGTISREMSIVVRTYPWNAFEDTPRTCDLCVSDTEMLDPEHRPIPLLDSPALSVCRRVHTAFGVVRIGACPDFSVTRGEINQTIYREFIGEHPSHSRLVKGVEVGRYQLRDQLSQGSREWFDEAAFLREHKPKPVATNRRIATQRITGLDERWRIVATIVGPKAYFADSTNSIVATVSGGMAMEYLLGVLNSRLIQWRFKLTSTNNNVGTNELNSLPIRALDLRDGAERAMHDKIVLRVKQVLELVEERRISQTAHSRTAIQRQIDAADRKIDELVYELYGLTDEEIRVVEDATP